MNEFKKKRGVVYARANKCPLASLVYQVLICQEKMKEEMVEEIHAPIYDVRSGMSFDMTALEELKKLAKGKSIDYVYVSDFTVLGREISQTVQLMKDFAESDVTVKTIEGKSTSNIFEDLKSASYGGSSG